MPNCTKCGSGSVYNRVTISPEWRCQKCGNTFSNADLLEQSRIRAERRRIGTEQRRRTPAEQKSVLLKNFYSDAVKEIILPTLVITLVLGLMLLVIVGMIVNFLSVI